VKLALGIVFLFMGAACLAIGSHGLEASTPWQAYSSALTRMREA
jgi:hypothetical protein